jgi:hypothetical protein
MPRHPEQTPLSGLGDPTGRLWGSTTKPLTCRPQHRSHARRKWHRSPLVRFRLRGAFSVSAPADQSGDPGTAPARHAVPPRPDRSGFSQRAL